MSWTILLFSAVFSPTLVLGDPVTKGRVAELSPAHQSAWTGYLERSAAHAKRDADALESEVLANKMPRAIRAPNGGDFKVSHKPGDSWYLQDEAKHLADVILSYQSPSGGWSKHLGFSKGPRQPGMQWTSQNEPGDKPHYLATFDNGSTTEEMAFLANISMATGRSDCQQAFKRGLLFILEAQFPTGGWPQVYPLEGGYHDNITFNDNAMANILELLLDIKTNPANYPYLDETLRQQARESFSAGIECVLKTQYTVLGKKTAWCAQHDPLTLQPAHARKMEPATLSGQESANLLKFLMTIPEPSPELVTCIEQGLIWLDSVRLTGIRKTNTAGKTSYEADPNSTEIYWARFYDLNTGSAVFPGRDGIIYPTFASMAETNRVGYDYYTSLPLSVVTNGQKKWRKKLATSVVK